jgi:hypothetical protein
VAQDGSSTHSHIYRTCIYSWDTVRDASTVGASWGSMCTAVGDSSSLDESEVLGLDRHQQFGLQDLLAATKEKISYNLALCSVGSRSDRIRFFGWIRKNTITLTS